MKNTVLNNLLMSCTIFFLCFCTYSSTKNKRILDETFISKSDTLIKDLPKDNKGEISKYYLIKEMREKPAGFKSLENGFDSIKMRFWYRYGYNDTMQIIEIENSNKKWNAFQYTIQCNYTEHYDSMYCIGKTVKHLIPKSGWENFIGKLFTANVLILPNFESYYAPSTDASTIGVEIATKNNYRYYLYSDPLHNKGYVGARDIVKIMDLIEDELNVKRIERF